MTPLPMPTASSVDAVLGKRVSLRRIEQLRDGRPVTFEVLEPGLAVLLGGAWPHADSPAVRDLVARIAARRDMRARLDAALGTSLRDTTIASLVSELVAIDPSVLDASDRLRLVVLADRVSGWAQAAAATALAGYAGPAGPDDGDSAGQARRDRHLRLEVRVARGISDDSAGRDIDAARRLAAELAPVREAWSRGEVTFRHVAAFLDRTRLCPPELTTAMLDRLGDRMTSTPSTRITTVVNAALAWLDPRGQADRARHARKHEVGVHQRTLPDGLGQITVIDKVEVTRAMIDRIDDDADKVLVHVQNCPPCAEDVPDEIGPARAAALRTLVLGADSPEVAHAEASADGDEPATTSRTRARRGELQVVVDLATLLGLAENPGLLQGQPVPAEIACELASECGSLRRIVTDPVDGHLLDYGTRSYLPQPLRNHVAARDGTCRAPGCGQPASRCELDHVVPFPHGPSDVANTHMLCKRDHDSKTDGDLEVLEHLADGSTRWRTRDGQTGVTPPRPYLPETGPPPPPPDDEPCPF
jgi:hypothetical protein